ncbi:MAG TPA: hypothetical protein VGO80_21535 [Solirubrobacteraceae bacterium]|nr:hypothetical protein [Solirubrobacteraceae bacterium]
MRILEGLRECFDYHAASCGDRVLAIAISDEDWDELQVAEIWGLPVLAWDEVEKGRLQLLCEANGRLIPPHDTLEDLLNHWNYRLQPPPAPELAR